MELIVVAGLPVLAWWLWSRRTPRAVSDSTWAGTHDHVQARDGALAAGPLALPLGPGRVWSALARSEARLIATSAALAQGFVFCILTVVLLYGVWASDGEQEALWEHMITFPIMCFPLAGMTIVASHRAVLRGRRDGCEELFEATPSDLDQRTVAHLATAWVPALVAVAFWPAVLLGAQPIAFGGLDLDLVVDGITGVAIVVGGCWLGVLLARLAPWSVVPVLAIVAVGAVATAIGGAGGHTASPLRQLSLWPRYPDFDVMFTHRPVFAHLLYVSSLGLACALGAVALQRRTRAVAGAAGVVLVLLVGAAVVQTRPIPAAEAQAIADMVSDGEAAQECRTTELVRACAYPRAADLIDGWIEPAAAALAGAPPDQLEAPMAIEQRIDASMVERLAPEVRRRLDGAELTALATGRADSFADDGRFHPGFAATGTEPALRLAAGLWAVDLPLAAPGRNTSCFVGGRSAAVIAIWLAFHDLPREEALALVEPQEYDPEMFGDVAADFLAGSLWPQEFEGWPPVVWAPSDLAAARLLLNRPLGEVRPQLWSQWERLTAPESTTTDLLAALDLGEPEGEAIPPAQSEPCRR